MSKYKEEWDGYITKSDAIWGIERLKYLGKEPKHTFYNSAILDINNVIASLPEAIVRCKDCVNWKDTFPYSTCELLSGHWEEDMYCSYGERKNE